MANLRLAMDAAFWDLDLSSAQTLDGTVRFVPGEPPPLPISRSSRTVRPQQLSFFRDAFPLGIIPSFSPTAEKGLGSFTLLSLLFGPSFTFGWMGLVGQIRPSKLISNLYKECTSGDELEFPAFKDVAKHVKDKSLYALGLFSQLSLTDDTDLLFNVDRHGDRKGHRSKATILHKLPNHDITLEAAWPEMFLDKKGTYWEVPASASLNIASLISPSGLRYLFGLHRNSGQPESLNSSSDSVPSSLMPGTCAKAALSYEKSRDLWGDRKKKKKKTEKPVEPFSYDVRLKDPHAAISGIIGGTCAAWFGGNESVNKRDQFTADVFGSICYTVQHGKFTKDFNDLSRVDARLDICSASSFVKGAYHFVSGIFKGHVNREVDPLASPKINVIFQQQLVGPIIFRMDSRVSLGSPSGKCIPHVEDVMYGLSYSLFALESGKILAWFSPKRKEAMVEVRLFEF